MYLTSKGAVLKAGLCFVLGTGVLLFTSCYFQQLFKIIVEKRTMFRLESVRNLIELVLVNFGESDV